MRLHFLIVEQAVREMDIRSDIYNSLNYFSPTSPDDGLVYMRKYIFEEEPGDESRKKESSITVIPMSQAFEKKYGKKWVESKEARTVLLWLLLESGRNYATETYSEYIIGGDLGKYKAELAKLGIKIGQI